mmetsp:Transcript_7533/g.11494  ORF Transcript_7533/g.11494 Transcript_7533/m.11494 type:complete len:294 (+) Transcript_7533:100-981(+)
MKVVALILSALIGAASGAPAIVWTNGGVNNVVHSSGTVKASSLISELVEDSDSSLDAAVFLIERSPDGSESLTGMTSSGALPLVSAKYNDASTVHSHVNNIKTANSVARETRAASGKNVLKVTLSEFSSKMTSLDKDADPVEEKQTKEQKALGNANVLVISIPADTDPSIIDEAVVKAVDHKSVGSVVLTAVRSSEEVKQERLSEIRRQMTSSPKRKSKYSLSGRRLEEDNGDENNNNDGELIYYVPMTPNILAGILFTLFFIVVLQLGLSCMGAIEGQSTYVKKMPSIGREA